MAVTTINDLVEEAKVRTVWLALCIFVITYFLSRTSSSMLMNLPVSVFLVLLLRILSNEMEFNFRRHHRVQRPSYLSHLEKKQLSLPEIPLPFSAWKKKIHSPIVEAALNNFVDKILKDFVVDLWYSEITPDTEFPELVRGVIMDSIGEISERVKELNLVDLLTRDAINILSAHLDLFRHNQAAIGVDVMRTLSMEERDERLKHHLMASRQLYPALISTECEYKVLQQMVSGVLAVVLRPAEAQCSIVQRIGRELLTCLVMLPIMKLASPVHVNELIECALTAFADDGSRDICYNSCKPTGEVSSTARHAHNDNQFSHVPGGNLNSDALRNSFKTEYHETTNYSYSVEDQELSLPSPSDWTRMLEVANQRRTEVLAPENLENLWTRGRTYKRRDRKAPKASIHRPIRRNSKFNSFMATAKVGKEKLHAFSSTAGNGKVIEQPLNAFGGRIPQTCFSGTNVTCGLDDTAILSSNKKASCYKRSSSTSELKSMEVKDMLFLDGGTQIISEFYTLDSWRAVECKAINNNKESHLALPFGEPHSPKLRCQVLGAYFEKIGTKSFAVYTISVTDNMNRCWIVKRRYRNFERLHRHLKEIPNYTLHLPPKRIFSSSMEDSFVHQRCVQLDKYLQDLLAIANIAEQHEVWDFLSASSKNYSFVKYSSLMQNIAVSVDDAVDNIFCQSKGASNGLKHRVAGSAIPTDAAECVIHKGLSSHSDEWDTHTSIILQARGGFSDSENHCANPDICSLKPDTGWHSDDELNTRDFSCSSRSDRPRIFPVEVSDFKTQSQKVSHDCSSAGSTFMSNHMEDFERMPQEWVPPNVSVPLLNLVDKVFQLKKRGWLRRQVLWISKQILQLVMEDAIDDWLLSQICWLRKEDTIAMAIQSIQNLLWPDGKFFMSIEVSGNRKNSHDGQFGHMNSGKPSSFEDQLEAARRVSHIKKMLLDGAPLALVSLIGQKQYKRCARDIFYFTQSSVCVKQLAYAMLELLLVSVFPELREVLLRIHGDDSNLP